MKYAAHHPEPGLSLPEIPQIPGYRRASRPIHGVAESLITNGYVIPIVFLNPYIAGGVLADYLVSGRYRLAPKNPAKVEPDHQDALINSIPPLSAAALTSAPARQENSLGSPQAAVPIPNGDASAAAQLNQHPEEQ